MHVCDPSTPEVELEDQTFKITSQLRRSELNAALGYTGHPVSRKKGREEEKKGGKEGRRFQKDMKREGRSERW